MAKPTKNNLLGPTTKDDIKVGYIDPNLGYVTGISIAEANRYARKNPGTVFIFEDGNGDVRYLRINEVNNLNPSDTVSTVSNCGGITRKKCGPPKISFLGGAGIGAKANPIVGVDGAILAVDIIEGGFAYQYAPIVRVNDFCNNGSGTVMTAVIGETVEKEETFENESDFEEYDDDPDDERDYGDIYDINGLPIGPWNPNSYTGTGEDPIQKEIQKYQDFLKNPTPWWDSRRKKPNKITAQGKNFNSVYKVSHPCGISTVSLKSTDKTGQKPPAPPATKEVEFRVRRDGSPATKSLQFVFESTDGSDRFVIKNGDENKKTYNIKKKVKLNVKYKVTVQGTGESKDANLEQGLSDKKNKEIGKDENGNRIFGDIVKSVNDNDDMRITLPQGSGKFLSGDKRKAPGGKRSTYDLFYILEGSVPPPPPAKKEEPVKQGETWNQFMNTYAISPVPPSNVTGSDFAGQLFTMEWREEFPHDGEYTFRGICDNIATLYLDNDLIDNLKSFADNPRVIKKTVTKGIHTVRVDLLNKPVEKLVKKPVPSGFIDVKFDVYGQGNFKDLSFSFVAEDNSHSFILKGADKNKKTRTDTIKVKPNLSYKVTAKEDSKRFSVVEQGLLRGTKKDKEGGLGTSNQIFADYLDTRNDNDDIQITANSGKFTSSNKRKTPKGRSTFDLTFKLESDGNTNNELSSGIQSKNVFNTVDYIKKADRKLWRTNPTAASNASLIHRLGVAPFDTTKTLDDNPYAGTHTIIWENVDFPVDGNYKINIAVDDNVTLFIGNRNSGGEKADGSGRVSVTAGGDEVIIRHQGFITGTSKSLPNFSETRFFKKGKYRLRADLEQIPGGAFAFTGAKGSNPMALAIDIAVDFTEETVVSSKSWCENPMGVALTIEAPPPPVPQENPPPQLGRCPNNPFWTTRFPGARERWYPVRFEGSGSSSKTTTQVTENKKKETDKITPKFIKNKTNKRYYLDLRGYKGEVNLDLQFIIKDTKKGGDGFAGTLFKIEGTNIKFDRKKQNGKVITDLNRSSSFKLKGGQLYGPVIFKGKTDDTSVVLKSEYRIASLDPGSTRRLKDGTLKDNIDFDVVIKGASVTKDNSSNSQKKASKTWSKFMNRYAISPVPPLDSPGSDRAGVVYTNSWDVEVPQKGFYGIQALGDNRGRILIDGVEVAKAEGFGIVTPTTTKYFLETGRHTITTEITNTPVNRTYVEREVIFTTKDWQVEPPAGTPSTVTVEFDVYGQGNFNDLAFSFVAEDGSDSFIIEGVSKNKQTRTDKIKVKPNVNYKVTAKEDSKKFNIVEQGLLRGTKKDKEGGIGTSDKIFADYVDTRNDNDDIQITAKNGEFTSSDKRKTPKGRSTYDLTFKVKSEGSNPPSKVVKKKDDVIYTGPPLFHHIQTTGGPDGKGWGIFMNKDSVSPRTFKRIDQPDNDINGEFVLTWENVDFPETGDYEVKFQADNIAVLKIDGVKVDRTSDFVSEPTAKKVNVTKGKHTISIELTNIKDRTDIFLNNPMGTALDIRKDISRTSQANISWNQNPVGISARITPPPCAKIISGRGVITKVIIEDPGNGYIQPSDTPENYPVLLKLTEIVVTNPGINYNCGVDIVEIVPDNGSVLSYSCDTFGRITKVNVDVGGDGFTTYPTIRVRTPETDPTTGRPITPTGINFSAVPVFEVIRDPIVEEGVLDPNKLIQVTDLAGLKQTGYIDGRAYYGAVFYENGLKYAGYFKTVGSPVRVYDTLQESITGRVTTPPVAIERSGTDTNSNNPRLNIPGTPGNPPS